MLWSILTIILVLWLAGLVLNIAGGFIHLLLVLAAAILLYRWLSGRKA